MDKAHEDALPHTLPENLPFLERKRTHSSSSSLDAEGLGNNPPDRVDGTSAKRLRITSPAGPSSTASPKILFVHRVECKRAGSGHSRHDKTQLYQDHPRLFKGDSGASLLRGTHSISDLQAYFHQHHNLKLAIVRTYQCGVYHDEHAPDFTEVELPITNPSVPEEVKPFLQVLLDDGDPATPEQETIDITHALSQAMKSLASTIPDILPNWVEAMKPPYIPIYRARELIRSVATDALDSESLELVLLVIDYVEQHFGPDYDAAEEMFATGLVSLEHLTKLFRHNEPLVTMEENEPVCYIAKQCPTRQSVPFSLNCYTWSFNGSFRRREKLIFISWPSKDGDPIPITDLQAFPIRFDLSGELESTLRKRGQTFWSCRNRNFLGYDAPITSFEIQVSNPRYMVDVATYQKLHPDKEGQQPRMEWDDLGKEATERDEPPPYPFVLLLPPRIMGFGLHDKKWRTLLVKHLRPVSWNKKAFEQLVLDPQKKELVEAMVRMHMSSNISTDLIENKGKGLIVLLHGGPGTGKTLTAESIAELVERPLYRVTCGDIGTEPEGVERYLESVLYIGSIWKAVVLLDESDVFLEEREKTDLQRNALVSVFLRALEYYDGILVLTSNRVGHFDEAFKSRVQLALHYPPLEEKGRWQIWHNFIKMLDRQQASVTKAGMLEGEHILVEELLDKVDFLAREKLNGRQIRNCITTARQLARFRNQSLAYSHLAQTIQIVNDFEVYVEAAHGHSASEYAKASGLRLE